MAGIGVHLNYNEHFILEVISFKKMGVPKNRNVFRHIGLLISMDEG